MLSSNGIGVSKDSLPLIDWKRRLIIARSEGIGDNLHQLENIIKNETVRLPVDELPSFEETGDEGFRGETVREQEEKWLDLDLTELKKELCAHQGNDSVNSSDASAFSDSRQLQEHSNSSSSGN